MSLGTLEQNHAAMTDRAYLRTPEQWTRFLSAFVHELRTPLASLRLLTDLLAGPSPGPRGDLEKRYVANIQEVSHDLQALVGEVAELGQLLSGRVQIRPDEVALEPLVEKIEEEVRPRAWEGGIALTGSLDPALPPLFRTDPDRLRQALTLLLTTTVGHAKSEVSFRLIADGGDLLVVLSSDGPPFPEAALRNLFEPFEEGVRTARRRGGYSLALPLANELARVLGGTLHAENRAGRPTFDLSLPAAAA